MGISGSILLVERPNLKRGKNTYEGVPGTRNPSGQNIPKDMFEANYTLYKRRNQKIESRKCTMGMWFPLTSEMSTKKS